MNNGAERTAAIQTIAVAKYIAQEGFRFDIPENKRFLTASSYLDKALHILEAQTGTELAQARAHEVYGDIALDVDISLEPLPTRPEDLALIHYNQAIYLLSQVSDPNLTVDSIIRITEKMINAGIYNFSTSPNGKNESVLIRTRGIFPGLKPSVGSH